MAHIDINGVSIFYEVVAGSGPPLLLHHGLSDSGRGWHDYGYVKSLRSDYTLVLIDARGHGRSARLHEPEAYHPADVLAGDVLAVMDELFIHRAHYFGYSLGGRVGFELARRAPGRLRSLVLGGAHPYATSQQQFRTLFAQGLSVWIAALEAQAGRLPPEVRARVAANDIDAMRAVVAKDREDIAGDLAHLTVPCRLYVGGDDQIVPLVERCARELPNTSCVVLPKFNHFSLYLQGAAVLPLILNDVHAFLAGADASGRAPAAPAQR